MQYHLRYCLACSADQETDEQGPCTDCSSDQVTALTYNPGTIVMDDPPYRKYGTARPWQEQWYRTKVHFRELQAQYQPGGYRSDEVAKDAIEDFFEHCHRTADWVRGDAMTCKRRKRKVDRLFRKVALKLCADISNTAKHRGRNLEGSTNAVVRRVYQQTDNSASADIEWWKDGKEKERKGQDALELAEQCMAAWREFLKKNDLRLWEVKTRKNDI